MKYSKNENLCKYNKNENLCKYNIGVNCDDQNCCDHCGFDPDVEAKRLAEARKRVNIDKLRACPFCGGAAVYSDYAGGVIVSCVKCHVQTPVYATKFAAHNAWDWRA